MNLDIQILTWIMTTIGLTGFLLVGKKLWWAWYINLGVQILWAIYALATGQPAFLASAATYFLIFALNAYKWTKAERKARKLRQAISQLQVGGMVIHDGVTFTRNEDIPQSADEHLERHFERAIPLIAQVCHEANRVLQLANHDENPSYPWHLASEAQKKSAIEGVKVALEGATAEELHESWARQKLADGWVYGQFKDEGIKTHPCLVPYSELPEEQRIKDHMFRAIVKAFKLQKQYANLPQS
jgi:hypothetical protein